MLNMKKALIAGAILTAFAASAYAADVQEAKPSMKERVNKILRENDQQPGMHKQHKKGPGFQRPRLTPEQREKIKNMTPEERKAFFKERHEQWIKNLTPEQKAKYEQHRKMMLERRAAHQKLVKEKMGKLSDAQRAEVEQFIKDDIAQRKAMGERIRNMTPDQREALKVAYPGRYGHGPKFGFNHKGHGPQKFHHGPQDGKMMHKNGPCAPKADR